MSDRRRVLISWVGHADLIGLAQMDRKWAGAVEKATGREVPRGSGPCGPIHAAVRAFDFDEVHLIADQPAALMQALAKSLDVPTKVHRVTLSDPTEYAAVYSAEEEVLAAVASPRKKERRELWISLSSGTPAMAATLVLLGKTRFPARFIQSYRGVASEASIPFDLTLEYLPELLREPDAALQALADKSPSEIEGFDGIVGDSSAIRLAVGRAKRAAVRDVPVLILGESGTGKELFAQAIHAASHRRERPFVPINCAAIPRELQESELFGHKKGAFTGAEKDRKGAFHLADGGTLFLDEFGELDLRTQAALLRALQPGPDDPPCRRVIRRVGAERDDTVDVRIIAATNRDPHEQIVARTLRDDLFYRVSAIVLRLPALRERRSDIPAIAQALLARINAQFAAGEPGYEDKSLSAAAKGFVSRHPWPGNVRQVSNALVQAAVMTTGNTIGKADIAAAVADLPDPSRPSARPQVQLGDGFSLPAYLDDVERDLIELARDEAAGVKTKAASMLGLKSYQTLDGKLRRLGIKWQ